MSHLTRGPGEAGDRQQANASNEQTPVGCASQYRSGGDRMSYLARGSVGTTGVDSEAHASREPTPLCAQTVGATGGHSMSPRAIPVSAGSVSITTPQAAP